MTLEERVADLNGMDPTLNLTRYYLRKFYNKAKIKKKKILTTTKSYKC